MRVRTLVICALAAAAAAFPAAATAQAAPSVRSVGAVAAYAKPTVKPVAKPVKPVKPAKAVKFTVTGTVTAVDADARTLTLTATGGLKDLRDRSVTVSVAADAKIVVAEARATLADVQVGHRVTVLGVGVGDVLTAAKVSSSTP